MRARSLLWPWWVVLLGACAETPPRPAPPSDPPKASAAEVAVSSAIAAHRKEAERAAAAGNLAAARREWRILALLAPGNAQFRAQEEATRAAIDKNAGEQIQSANAALRAGDTDRAGAALLKALALDPDNADAMKALREIDRQKLARIQGSRAARVNQAAAANTSASRSAGATSAPVDPSESYDIDQRIEMFRAGDLDRGLKELRAFVDANPNNQAARQRIGATVYERAREAEAKGAREQALMLIDQASALPLSSRMRDSLGIR